MPAGRGTRPTAQRTREAVFSTLDSLVELDGAVVADLYAGSGALGLEALSRGARRVRFVESDPRAAATITANLRALALPGGEVVADRVERVVAAAPPEPCGVVLADPPYHLPDATVTAVLEHMLASGWLAPGAVVVVERSSRDGDFVWPMPLAGVRERRYGDALVRYGRAP